MKKIIKGLILVLTAVWMIGCGSLDNSSMKESMIETWSESSATEGLSEAITETESEGITELETDENEKIDAVTELNVHYIRGGDSSSEESAPRVIRSAEEFETYCEAEKAFASKAEFQTATGHFDKSFWENYDLVLAKWVESYSSIRHEVLSITREGNESSTGWVINVRPLLREGSAVLTAWTFMIEVPEGVLKTDASVLINYAVDTRQLIVLDTTCFRTDTWKSEDDSWRLGENLQYFIDSEEELKTYCKAHPELSEGFFEFCAKFNDEFWQKKDLLLVVQHEESSGVRYNVRTIFQNQILGSDLWFVDMERHIPKIQTTDEAIWHIFIEVEEGKLDAKNEIRVHDREMKVED